MKRISCFMIGLCVLLLAGCGNKIPEGMSQEMYEVGKETVEITEKYLDGKETLEETVDALTKLAEEGVDILEKVKSNLGTLKQLLMLK